MSKTRDTGFLGNVVKVDSTGNVSFVSGSTTLLSISSSGAVTTTGVISGSNALSSSYALNADQVDGLNSTSFVFTSSYNTDSSSVSTRVTRIEGNYATTGSNVFLGAQTVCANITSTGTIIAQTLNVQQVTSSIVYSSGSNIFGCSLTNTQQFTGSMLVTGSNALFSVGCLGIGTTSPVTKLDVIGNARLFPASGDVNLSLRGFASQYINFTEASVADRGVIGFAIGSGDLVYRSGGYDMSTGTERIRITSTGIACFACQICTAGLYSNCSIGINSYNSAIPLQIKRWAGSSGTVILIGNDNVVGMPSISFCNDNGGGTAFVSMTANCQININGSIYACPSGNVGIGTTSPTCKLEVDGGASAVGLRISTTSAGTGTAALILANSSKSAFNDGMIMTHGGGYTNITTLTGATVMAWDMTSCRVGVGTVSPSTRLTVRTSAANQAVANITSTTGNNLFNFISNDTPGHAILDLGRCTESGIFAAGYIRLRTDGDSWIQGGNVGIGTTSPASGKLEIQQGATTAALWAQTGGTTSSYVIADFRTGTNLSALQILGNGVSSFNGNVGIGTADPSLPNGGGLVLYKSDYPRLQFRNSTSGDGSLDGAGFFLSNNNFYISNRETADIVFEATANTERMRITSGGNVGINTTDPKANLHVCGSTATLRVGPWFSTNDRDFIQLEASGTDTRILSPNERFKIENPDGCVQIVSGTSGGVQLTPGATSWASMSDIRKKKNFEPTQGLAALLQIEPVKYHFQWDNDCMPKRMGFIAQNIQPLIPEMVSKTDEKAQDGSDYLTITPDYILPVLVKSIQEQQCTICMQSTIIDQLRICLGIS